VNNGALAVSDQSVNRPINADVEIESLARETDMPIEIVQAIYTIERAKLERMARIKTYLPVLIHRHVKALLRQHRASS
jgi:gamma-glutamyl phosphate reductase